MNSGKTRHKDQPNPAPVTSEEEDDPDNAEVEIDCDILLVMASNGKKIDPNKLERGKIGQKIWAPYLKSATEKVCSAQVKKYPDKIFIGLGQNDVANEEERGSITDNFKKLCEATKSKFPDAEIYVASIFTRKDRRFQQEINNTNTALATYLRKGGMTLVNNQNISHFNLYDTKHLNNQGLFIYLTNMKFAMFGKIPGLPSNNADNNQRGQRRFHNQAQRGKSNYHHGIYQGWRNNVGQRFRSRWDDDANVESWGDPPGDLDGW